MWLVKGRKISFEMADGPDINLPVSFGMIHNPKQTTKCRVYFGPYEKTPEQVAQLPHIATLYFGSDYNGRVGYVDIPEGKWTAVGDVTRIYYERPGEHADYYQHPFDEPVPLSRNRQWHRIVLPKGCVVNERGFVQP
jgi:hypothetical protein